MRRLHTFNAVDESKEKRIQLTHSKEHGQSASMASAKVNSKKEVVDYWNHWLLQTYRSTSLLCFLAQKRATLTHHFVHNVKSQRFL